MSQHACSMPPIAEASTSPGRKKCWRTIVCQRCSTRCGSSPTTRVARSSTHATTARVFHSTVASPQPTSPSSVSSLTKTQLRISAPTTTVETPLIRTAADPTDPGRRRSNRERSQLLNKRQRRINGRSVMTRIPVHRLVVPLLAVLSVAVWPHGGHSESAIAAGSSGPPFTSLIRPYPKPPVRTWRIQYVAHDGLLRRAFVQLPAWYGPRHDPPIPLIISPHGRGIPAWLNLRRWGDLPARGGFAVVNPEGQGRVVGLDAWGDPGDISDLAKMPRFVRHALPWVHIAAHRIYAFGASMGGQETLLLVARYPHLLAGAAAFDAPTNMAARYAAFPFLRFGRGTQRLLRIETGGTPETDPQAYAIRSPIHWARQIAFSGVPLQIWWSRRDRTVVDEARESGALYRAVKRLNRWAPVTEHVGAWVHTAEMRARARLPRALAAFGLIRVDPVRHRWSGGGL